MKNGMEKLIEQYDSFDYYLNDKLNRDIEENRKGQFVINFKDKNGEAVSDVNVKITQVSHEFNFGCSLFHLEQFADEERNKLYKEKFKKIFNYGVVPLYWDTLEPVEGEPRFEKDCQFISRRPPVDTVMEFCKENNIRTKGHCLIYNSFQPDWISDINREIKIQIDNRIKAIAERYGNAFEDLDVINEMISIYKNCYKGNGARNLQITDERNHEKWSYNLCRRYFPHSRLFWNEGMFETFGDEYKGYRSFYYMTLEKMLSQGVDIEGIGMQYHAYSQRENAFEELRQVCNPLRLIDAFECYGEFGLPIHISEVSIPSYSNDDYDEQLQAELTKRLLKLWFGGKNCEAVVWWNLADKTAYKTESAFHAGLIREDCTEKPAYKAMEELINKEWRTDFERNITAQLRFSGFYGEYDIEAVYNGRKTVKRVRLHKENTGYDNRLCDFRSIDIILI